MLSQSKIRKYSLYFLSLLWSSPGFLASAVPSMLCGFFRSWLLILAAGLLSLLLFWIRSGFSSSCCRWPPFFFGLLILAAVGPGRRSGASFSAAVLPAAAAGPFVPGRRSFVGWLFAAVGPGCRPFVCFFVPGFLFSSGS